MAYQSRHPVTCNEAKCSGKHHSLLHPPAKCESQTSTCAQESTESRKKPDREVVETSSTLCSATQTRQGVSMWIVPIKVRTNGKEIVANAFFDSRSDVTLFSSSLVERLEGDGPEKTLTLNTNGDGESKPSRQVSLTISSLGGSASIELPEVYAIDKIAIRTVSVPRDQLQRYPHSRNLNLPSVDEVSLLVGANAPEAFCIEDIRKEKGKQPFAVKLPLG